MNIDKEFDIGKFSVFYGYNGDGGYWFYFKKVGNAIFFSLCKFYFEISWDDDE